MMNGYSEFVFRDGPLAHSVFRRGSGPGVVIAHEFPLLTESVVRFANSVVDAGFCVFIPCFAGMAGRDSVAQCTRKAALCIRREFDLFARHSSSPMTIWLRALCQHIHEELSSPPAGIGFIGMCITGNFALSMMVEEFVTAPILSQPSLPMPLGSSYRAALHLSEADLEIVKRRSSEGVPVLGLRFTGDVLCPKQRFATLRNVLGAGFEGIEIDSSRGNPHGIPKRAHSVLTLDLVDKAGHPTAAARDRVIEFLQQQLKRAPQ